ncbi:hypothetical protein [Streptomyces sp. NPDC048659]|uniref:effector-associated constant component EACC1 n=1 Tax=Streptomyces sp. NPDC048659 TaxID=3155489 RepID=UPI0034331FA6
MDIEVRVEGAGPGDDALRDLRSWLAGADGLRGRVEGVESPPRPGALGPTLDALAVAVGPAGAATAFATGVVAWLRTRRGDVRVKVTVRGRGSAEVTARRVAGLDAEAVRRQVEEIIGLIGQPQDGAGPRELP